MVGTPSTGRPFIHEDFLLDTPAAVRLYHEYAEHEPICDYHCHLIPTEIAADRTFANITQAWLYGDHYKWRMMRADGAMETEATGPVSAAASDFPDGPSSDRARFDRSAATHPAGKARRGDADAAPDRPPPLPLDAYGTFAHLRRRPPPVP